MKKLLLLLCFLVAPVAVHAEPQLGIVATVNDDAITNNDLEGRMKLMLLGSGIQPNPEVLAKLRAQVLRTLVDERLQAQEAKGMNVTVEDKEIDEQVAQLASQNNTPAAQLPAYFARNGVPFSALREQLRASLAWGKVVQRKLRPRVDISDDEVDAEIARIQANAGKPEYLVADIYLPVDTAAQESSVQQTAYKLIDTMAKGARFSGIARQFSQAATAATGGDMGWLQPGQLEPQLDEEIRKMSPGSLSQPIRTSTGYHILMLRDVRMTQGSGVPDVTKATFDLRQVLIPLGAGASQADVTAASSKIERLQQQAKSCADMERMAGELGDPNRGRIGKIEYAKLPPALQGMLGALPDLKPTSALRNEHGALFLMICSRTTPEGAVMTLDRGEVMNRIGAQKLELQARRYLRDLRQSAFIDIRG